MINCLQSCTTYILKFSFSYHLNWFYATASEFEKKTLNNKFILVTDLAFFTRSVDDYIQREKTN